MPQERETVNLLELVVIALKRKRMITAVTAAAFAISVMVALALPKVYTATARFLPPQQDNSLLPAMAGSLGGLVSAAGGLLGGGTTADTFVGILRSEGVKDRIIDRFRLMDVYGEKYRGDLYRRLDRLFDISAGKKDGIVTIAVDDRDPRRAAEIANALVEEVGRLTAGLDASGAGRQREFLEQRLAKARGELAAAEESLKDFQGRNKALDVTQQARATMEGLAQLKAQLAVQEVQLAALRSRYTDETQDVRDVKATMANLQRQIGRLEGAGDGGAIPGVGAVPDLGERYLRLMREFKVRETVVELLTKQYETAKLLEAKEISTLQVIQPARVPDRKNRPKRSLIVLLSTFVAFSGAVVSAFFLEYLQTMPEEDRRLMHELRLLLRARS